jgi:uncharacterized protein (DUF1501 family)
VDIENSDIRKNPQVRAVFEALLLDPRTPETVFQELFGVDLAFVTEYKKQVEGLWDIPRVLLYNRNLSLRDKRAADLYMDVYNGGWEVVDSLFNRGRNINAAETAMRVIRISAAKAVTDAIKGEKVNPALINAAKNMVGTVSTYQDIAEASTEEEWTFMVEELEARQKEKKVSSKTEEAYSKVLTKFKEREVNKGGSGK